MKSHAQQKPRSSTAKNTRPKSAQRKKDHTQAKKQSVKPAYLQKKMDVSSPGDSQEQEADRVAEEVSRKPRGISRQGDQQVQRASATPDGNEGDEQSLQAKPVISRMEEDNAAAKINRTEEEVQTQLQRTEDEAVQSKLQRMEEEESAQTKLMRTEEEAQTKLMREETDESAQASLYRQAEEEDQAQTVGLSDEAEQKIESLRGMGEPMQEDVLKDMEENFGADFSAVKIHTDGEADQLAKQINARAFAVGNDIFFAAGEYAPESEQGRKLLAHELTHVVQQSGAASRKVFRTTGSTPTSPPAGVTPVTPFPAGGPYEFVKDGKRFKYVATGSPKELHLPEVRVPNFKQRHQSLQSPPLIRPPGARDTNQRSEWRNHFNTHIEQPVESFIDSARRRGGVAQDGGNEVYFYKGRRNQQLMLFGNRDQIKESAVFPFWDSRQEARTFQVDHRREDQLGGSDELNNYELLDAGANGSSGSRIGREINNQIGTAVSIYQSPYFRSIIGGGNQRISGNPRYIKENYQIQFNRVRYNLGDVPNGDRYWSVNQITQGRHLQTFRPLTERELEQFGNPRRPMLYTSPRGGIGIRAPEEAGSRTEIWPRVVATGSLSINDDQHATLPVDAYRSGENTGGIQAAYPGLNFHFQPVPGMEGASTYKSWAIDKQASLAEARQAGSGGVFQSLRLPGLSPIEINDLDIDPGTGFIGGGKLLPTVPLFEQADIDVVVQGADVRLQKTFSFDEINVPSPLSIHHSSITAFVGTQGLGVEGLLGFGIDNVGDGELRAEVSTAAGLALDGKFAFDEKLFGQGTTAEVNASYRKIGDEEYAWALGGTVTIPEGKVPGINSATINVNYSESDGFSARGDATLDVPGVESGTLEISQSEEDGFSIGGTFNLSADTPGIRGGTISATLTEKEDGSGYALSASGEAQPDIPGINSNLLVTYDDGAFTAEVTAQYARGMLAGQINAGVTNRSVGEDGQLTDTAEPDNPLIVYGGGSLTIQIAPWLQGTAGVQFAPDGEITVTGEIGLPDELEIFARREINKSIFNIAVQAPIVPGIVAEVGGGLSATAGIGPGVIDELRLGITYNPAHEEDTEITGDAHLSIPANAGLRLSVRAGIGLGITGASATGGLDIGGTLGIEGEAEAGVHIEWTPASGLDLSANVAVHAQPSFTFDIGGYVSVRALGFSVYDERFEFASYTFGSDYRFGIRLPINYHEGEPFDISLDDVEFEVPDIDTDQLLSGLISRIT